MRLQKDDIAPQFCVKDINGNDFNLKKKRVKPLLISFFRYASCPLCNLRVHELIKNQDNFKKKLDLVFIFQSPKNKIEQYVGKQNIPYKVLADPSKSLYHLYAVENSWSGFLRAWSVTIHRVISAVIRHQYFPGSIEGSIHSMPADFLIDIDNKILVAYYSKDIGDHLPLDELDDILKK